MATIKEQYGHIARELIKNSIHSSTIDAQAVYQPANISNRRVLDSIIGDLILPQSEIVAYDQLQKLHKLAKDGHSCLILMEHYSNFDLPNLYYLLEHVHEGGEAIGEDIIAMAGMKLNMESDFVKAFTEAYTRIVIYPSRSLSQFEGRPEYEKERSFSRKINMAALHEMVRQKHAGKIILLFPSGTRYRPGEDKTRKGLAEVDSYIKGFDYMLPIGIAGNTLRINTQGEMSEDYVINDCMIFQAGQVLDAKHWREEIRTGMPEDAEPKQFVSDKVMELLAELHEQAETLRHVRLSAEA